MLYKVTTLALLGVASALTFSEERDFSGYSFSNYEAEFGKVYSNEQRASRAEIFNKNLELIRQHNAGPDKTWFATVNQFTDKTNTEFKRTHHGHSPPSPGFFQESELEPVKDLPASVDWRTKGAVSPVKNQGSCGSCWAFSAAETLESHYAISTGDKVPVLSPQQLVSCSPNPKHCGGSGGCDGSIQTLGFNYTETAGLTSEADYPYKASTGTCQPSNIKPVVKNTGYVALKPNDYNQLATAVATLGPVAISLAAGSFGWQIYGGGVFSGEACGVDMDHAVQLVGYGTEGATDYWIVRNSWGARWGEEGYIRMKRFGDGKEPCGVDKTPSDGEACEGDKAPRTYCGLCGIMGSSSYPTGVTKA